MAEKEGKLWVVGIGPGAYEDMTVRAARILEECDTIVGYTVYVELIRDYYPGKEFLSTAAFIVGEIPSTASVSILSTEDAETIRKHIVDAIAKVEDEDGVIILTDMFGGTPANVALSLLGERNVEIITGVNLPMVMEIPGAQRRGLTLYEVACALSKAGQKNIIFASDLLGKHGDK